MRSISSVVRPSEGRAEPRQPLKGSDADGQTDQATGGAGPVPGQARWMWCQGLAGWPAGGGVGPRPYAL